MKVAERFEKQHQEKAAVLEQKIAAMTQELALAEREVEEMKAEIRAAMIGGPAASAGPAGAARALRATLPEQTTLSGAEQHLLREWLDRLASEG